MEGHMPLVVTLVVPVIVVILVTTPLVLSIEPAAVPLPICKVPPLIVVCPL